MHIPYALARADLGLAEKSGADHEARILQMFADVGHPAIRADETSWCAAFVGAKLRAAGMPYLQSLAARAYLQWGRPVALAQAQLGDIAIFWRGSPKGWQGHVGFYAGRKGGDILVLGGNQADRVSIAPYPQARLLGLRRMADFEPAPAPPALSLWRRVIFRLLAWLGGRK